jgi:deazaflavin-dependent oxidoreductase (nitroreductase family)
MPFPKSLARFNKHVTNRFTLLLAGWVPPLAMVNHRGRSSGRGYRTPVLAFPDDGGFVFALTYGRDVDWVKNLRAHDSGSVEYGGLTAGAWSMAAPRSPSRLSVSSPSMR